MDEKTHLAHCGASMPSHGTTPSRRCAGVSWWGTYPCEEALGAAPTRVLGKPQPAWGAGQQGPPMGAVGTRWGRWAAPAALTWRVRSAADRSGGRGRCVGGCGRDGRGCPGDKARPTGAGLHAWTERKCRNSPWASETRLAGAGLSADKVGSEQSPLLGQPLAASRDLTSPDDGPSGLGSKQSVAEQLLGTQVES